MGDEPRPAAARGPIRIEIPGEMRGKGRPRFGRRGDFVQTFTDTRTKNAEAWVKSCAMDQAGLTAPLDGPLLLDMRITVEIPRSWSKKKQAAAARGDVRPTGKPDIDNSIKLVADALNKVMWRDDSQIVAVSATKGYGDIPRTVLLITPIGGGV